MTPPKKKIVKLNLNIENDYTLFAIVTSLNDYQLCWEINNTLHINLIRQDNFTYSEKKGTLEKDFAQYSFDDTINQCKMTLLSNKSENGVLFKELKDIDFLFKFSCQDSEDIPVVINKIKKIQGVIYANIVNDKTLEQKKVDKLYNILNQI